MRGKDHFNLKIIYLKYIQMYVEEGKNEKKKIKRKMDRKRERKRIIIKN